MSGTTPPPNSETPRASAGGFALLDVLLAMLVLGLAVAAMAGMQLTALRGTHQSTWRTAAVHLAADVADQMRASGLPPAQLAYDSRNAVTAQACHVAACNASQWLAFDQSRWQQRLRATLPGGRIVVCADGNTTAAAALAWQCNGGTLVVKIGWREPRPPAGKNAVNGITGTATTATTAPDAPLLVLPVGI